MITEQMIEKRRKQKQNEAHQRWVDNNREYLRQYRKSWREKYKAEHGICYETARLRAKAEQELRSEHSHELSGC